MDLAGFDYFQQSQYLQVNYNLQGAWVQELIKIIKSEFNDVGKGWFNMKETSRITYLFGKLTKCKTKIIYKLCVTCVCDKYKLG